MFRNPRHFITLSVKRLSFEYFLITICPVCHSFCLSLTFVVSLTYASWPLPNLSLFFFYLRSSFWLTSPPDKAITHCHYPSLLSMCPDHCHSPACCSFCPSVVFSLAINYSYTLLPTPSQQHPLPSCPLYQHIHFTFLGQNYLHHIHSHCVLLFTF